MEPKNTFTNEFIDLCAKQGEKVQEQQSVECGICAQASFLIGFGRCGDFLCWLCMLKIRVLAQKKSCPYCQEVLSSVCIIRCPKSLCEEKDPSPLTEKESNRQTLKNALTQKYFENGGLTGTMFHEQKYDLFLENEEIGKCVENVLHPFSCFDQLCSKSLTNGLRKFSTFKELQHHMHAVHKRQFCPVCFSCKSSFLFEQRFYLLNEINRHINGEDDEYVLDRHVRCKTCYKVLFDDEAYRTHVKLEHLSCYICDKDVRLGTPYSFGFFEELVSHYKRYHFYCDQCEYVAFETRHEISQHERDVHGGEKSSTSKPMLYPECEFYPPGKKSSRAERNWKPISSETDSCPFRSDHLGKKRLYLECRENGTTGYPQQNGLQIRKPLFAQRAGPPRPGQPAHSSSAPTDIDSLSRIRAFLQDCISKSSLASSCPSSVKTKGEYPANQPESLNSEEELRLMPEEFLTEFANFQNRTTQPNVFVEKMYRAVVQTETFVPSADQSAVLSKKSHTELHKTLPPRYQLFLHIISEAYLSSPRTGPSLLNGLQKIIAKLLAGKTLGKFRATAGKPLSREFHTSSSLHNARASGRETSGHVSYQQPRTPASALPPVLQPLDSVPTPCCGSEYNQAAPLGIRPAHCPSEKKNPRSKADEESPTTRARNKCLAGVSQKKWGNIVILRTTPDQTSVNVPTSSVELEPCPAPSEEKDEEKEAESYGMALRVPHEGRVSPKKFSHDGIRGNAVFNGLKPHPPRGPRTRTGTFAANREKKPPFIAASVRQPHYPSRKGSNKSAMPAHKRKKTDDGLNPDCAPQSDEKLSSTITPSFLEALDNAITAFINSKELDLSKQCRNSTCFDSSQAKIKTLTKGNLMNLGGLRAYGSSCINSQGLESILSLCPFYRLCTSQGLQEEWVRRTTIVFNSLSDEELKFLFDYVEDSLKFLPSATIAENFPELPKDNRKSGLSNSPYNIYASQSVSRTGQTNKDLGTLDVSSNDIFPALTEKNLRPTRPGQNFTSVWSKVPGNVKHLETNIAKMDAGTRLQWAQTGSPQQPPKKGKELSLEASCVTSMFPNIRFTNFSKKHPKKFSNSSSFKCSSLKKRQPTKNIAKEK